MESSVVDPTATTATLMHGLHASPSGLTATDAAQRLQAYGPNVLRRRGGRTWPRELLAQFTHPLALLLAAASVLAALAGITVLAVAIVAVIVLNAVLAFWQELQAVHAIEALQAYLPPQAQVLRDGRVVTVDAATLVPGDILVIDEGERICADGRLLDGAVECDMSALTGESVPVVRSADPAPHPGAALEAPDLIFSGTVVTGGAARAVVHATGMHTELGRVAALSQGVEVHDSPLQVQVRRVAWLIAVIAVAVGAAFIPLGVAAGLPVRDAVIFAIGLLVANVPEGLLPTITLALAVGVRELAGRRALVKRLAGVETLGATDVICTDKTGTLTENRMHVVDTWTPEGNGRHRLAAIAAACTTADLAASTGDPTELALLAFAREEGVPVDRAHRRETFRFDPARRLMTTIDEDHGGLSAHVKGAPDVVLERCRPMRPAEHRAAEEANARLAARGLRVLAVAERRLAAVPPDDARDVTERELSLVGLIGLLDPPRPEVAGAVARCHAAGIRIHVVTGDQALTAQAVARQVGIGSRGGLKLVGGAALDALGDEQLRRLLEGPEEIVFARSAPEAKLRIATALQDAGHVVAMTGDGVNDAPALRRADIGVAMGRSGTDVAREAATMVLTDDNFSTIVAAVEEGRRVYANIRKFILYIFAHAPAELLPFLVFALSGGSVPLPLTAVLILAIDLGTETLPALALGREPAEEGGMARPPRGRGRAVIDRDLLVRAWGVLGLTSALLVLTGFFTVLVAAGWSPGEDVAEGSSLHHAYLQAVSMTFLGIVACQVGCAFASRLERASSRTVSWRANPLLLWGIAFELVVAAAVVYLPVCQDVFATAAPPVLVLLLLPVFAVVVWAVDEAYRGQLRRRGGGAHGRHDGPVGAASRA